MSTYTVLPSQAIRHSDIRHGGDSPDDWRAKVDPRLLAFWSLGQRGRTALPGIVELLNTVLYPAAAQRGRATAALRLPSATVHSPDLLTCGPIASMAAGISIEGEETAVFRVSLKIDEDRWTTHSKGIRQRWRHGPHVIADVRQANLETLARLPSVHSIELARPASVTGCCCSNPSSRAHHTGPLNLPAPAATQPDPSALIGIVDLRFDVLHPDLAWRVGYQDGWPLYEAGTAGHRSKVRAVRNALTDQVTDSALIEDELVAWTSKASAPGTVAAANFTPYAKFPHKPVAADGAIDDHGTICAAVAAGRPNAIRGSGPGVAPDSELLLAALTGESGAPSGSTTATTTDVIESVAWMMDHAAAEKLPLAVNLSLGTHFGPHDGTSPEVQALDALAAQPGMAIILAAGNDNRLGRHVHADAHGSSAVHLRWGVHWAHGPLPVNGARVLPTTPDGLQVWANGADAFDGVLFMPDGSAHGFPVKMPADQHGIVQIHDGKRRTGLLFWDNRSNWGPSHSARIEVWWVPLGGFPVPEGEWEIELHANKTTGRVAVDAWLGTNDAANIKWVSPAPLVDQGTLSDLATGRNTIVVGNAATSAAIPSPPHSTHGSRLAATSGCGPTRDGRVLPDFTAPGTLVTVPCARDRRSKDTHPVELTRFATGTSVAAPVVTGVCAKLLGENPNWTVADLKAALEGIAHKAGNPIGWGKGVILK